MPWFTLLFAGCGAPSDDSAAASSASVALTAATLGPQTVLSNAEYLAAEPYASASREWGERLAGQCRACHTLDKGGATLLGPNLYGMFGRSAGPASGYAFSPALAEARFVWTPRALDAWLATPSTFLPGNRMAFGGIPQPSDRAAVIAYLLVATDGRGTSPEGPAGT